MAPVLAAAILVPAGDGSKCVVVSSVGRCLIAAVDPGRPGGPRGPAAATPNAPARKAAVAPTPRSPGATAAPIVDPQLTGIANGVADGRDTVVDTLLPPGVPRPAGGTLEASVATLTRRAVEQLTLRPPALHTSTGARGLVGVPVWLWIDSAATGPVTATAAVGAARVTATAELTGVEWFMGPPGAVVRCTGPGTPWTGEEGPSPDCGYVYALRSLPERTGGAGAWTITATCSWTVTFTGTSGGAPVAGAQTVQVSTSATLPVGEAQVLVSGPGS